MSNLDVNDPEILACVSAIQNAPMADAVALEAECSAQNNEQNFDAKLVPEFKPMDPAGPAPSTPGLSA